MSFPQCYVAIFRIRVSELIDTKLHVRITKFDVIAVAWIGPHLCSDHIFVLINVQLSIYFSELYFRLPNQTFTFLNTRKSHGAKHQKHNLFICNCMLSNWKVFVTK